VVSRIAPRGVHTVIVMSFTFDFCPTAVPYTRVLQSRPRGCCVSLSRERVPHRSYPNVSFVWVSSGGEGLLLHRPLPVEEGLICWTAVGLLNLR
jgi:hypothetical protein